MNKYKFSDIKVGLSESFEVQIVPSMMDKFLEISNDINSLHQDINYAKQKGFLGRVVYGLLTSSFYSTLVGVHLPGKYCILQGINIQFYYYYLDLMLLGHCSRVIGILNFDY